MIATPLASGTLIGNRGTAWRELAEDVVREQRQMRLPAAVIDDAEHAAVCVNIQRVPCCDGRRHRGVQEQMASSANETAQCLASGVRGEHVFADTRRPARDQPARRNR